MRASLPTAEELEKLPMRAVVAYAARAARRLSRALRGIVADHILDDALRHIESVATATVVPELEQLHVINAARRVIDAYDEASPLAAESPEKFVILFSFLQAAIAATHAIEAAANPGSAGDRMKRLARAAVLAVRPINALGKSAARSATEAACEDYELLLSVYGRHDDVELGEPVRCFEGKEE